VGEGGKTEQAGGEEQGLARPATRLWMVASCTSRVATTTPPSPPSCETGACESSYGLAKIIHAVQNMTRMGNDNADLCNRGVSANRPSMAVVGTLNRWRLPPSRRLVNEAFASAGKQTW
jgi:hypothetical protein